MTKVPVFLPRGQRQDGTVFRLELSLALWHWTLLTAGGHRYSIHIASRREDFGVLGAQLVGDHIDDGYWSSDHAAVESEVPIGG